MRAIKCYFANDCDRETSTDTDLIADLASRNTVLVDSVLQPVHQDLTLPKELGLTLRYCLETHIHAEYSTGTAQLRETIDCQGIVSEYASARCGDRFIQPGKRSFVIACLQLFAWVIWL